MSLALLPILAIFASVLLLVVLVVTRKSAGTHDEHAEGGHAHPFTIFGHAPLFYVAFAVVFGFTWFLGTKFLPSFNIWIVEMVVITMLYLVWPKAYDKFQSVWASVRGHHHHAHAPHGDDEADTIGMFFFWAAATYVMSVTWAMLGHCNSDTSCSVFNMFWLRLAEVSGRWFHCPANWIFVILMSMHSRLFKSRLWGYTLFGIWVFTVMSYVYGGYNTDPWDEVWRGSGQNPPALLQWLFPVTFG